MPVMAPWRDPAWPPALPLLRAPPALDPALGLRGLRIGVDREQLALPFRHPLPRRAELVSAALQPIRIVLLQRLQPLARGAPDVRSLSDAELTQPLQPWRRGRRVAGIERDEPRQLAEHGLPPLVVPLLRAHLDEQVEVHQRLGERGLDRLIGIEERRLVRTEVVADRPQVLAEACNRGGRALRLRAGGYGTDHE